MCESDADTLIAELTQAGFDKPLQFISEHGVPRVQQAWDYIKAKPPGQVKNIPGFLRYLVKTPGKVPQSPRTPTGQDPDKFIKGKFGHMVRR